MKWFLKHIASTSFISMIAAQNLKLLITHPLDYSVPQVDEYMYCSVYNSMHDLQLDSVILELCIISIISAHTLVNG